MSDIASFEDLTSGTEETTELKLQGGKSVRLRGISRYEYMLASKAMLAEGGGDLAKFESMVVDFGLVEPNLSLGQVTAWMKSPGALKDFQSVHEAIMELSGLRAGADKSDL